MAERPAMRDLKRRFLRKGKPSRVERERARRFLMDGAMVLATVLSAIATAATGYFAYEQIELSRKSSVEQAVLSRQAMVSGQRNEAIQSMFVQAQKTCNLLFPGNRFIAISNQEWSNFKTATQAKLSDPLLRKQLDELFESMSALGSWLTTENDRQSLDRLFEYYLNFIRSFINYFDSDWSSAANWNGIGAKLADGCRLRMTDAARWNTSGEPIDTSEWNEPALLLPSFPALTK